MANKFKVVITNQLNKHKSDAISRQDRPYAMAAEQLSDEFELARETNGKGEFVKLVQLRKSRAEVNLDELLLIDEEQLANIPLGMFSILEELEDVLNKMED